MKSYIGEGHDFIPLMSRSFNDFLVVEILYFSYLLLNNFILFSFWQHSCVTFKIRKSSVVVDLTWRQNFLKRCIPF